jgi:Outer membrane protein beta-barrel domain
MVNRFGIAVLLACGVVALSPAPVAAQQTLNFTLGGFVPRGFDARVEGDTLVENRNALLFDMEDFNGAAVGAEWLLPVGEYFELGAGLGFYRRTVPSIYEDLVDEDGTEIDQDLRLRIIPLTATIRVLPLGQSNGVQPYFGAGLGVFNWRYSESGEFVDTDGFIFRDSFVGEGNEPGVVGFGGIRFASDAFSVGGEIRYSAAEADLPEEFLGTAIDLGGWTYQFTAGFRF